MRPPALLLLLPLLLSLSPGHADAQEAIHHCVSANGTPVFTDQPCSSMHASAVTPAPPVATGAVARRRMAPPSCPASAGDLRTRVGGAFATHDANALAGLMLWGGYGHAAATADVRRLDHLVGTPLLGIEDAPPPMPASTPSPAPLPASAGSAATPGPPAPPGALVLHLGGVGDDRDMNPRFAIVSDAGCFWLSPDPL